MWLTFDGFSSEPMRNEFVWRGVGRTVGEPSRPGVSASRAKAGCLCLSKHRGLPPFSKGGLQQRGADAQRRREDQGSPHGYHPGHHRRWKQRSTRNHCLTNLSITPPRSGCHRSDCRRLAIPLDLLFRIDGETFAGLCGRKAPRRTCQSPRWPFVANERKWALRDRSIPGVIRL